MMQPHLPSNGCYLIASKSFLFCFLKLLKKKNKKKSSSSETSFLKEKKRNEGNEGEKKAAQRYCPELLQIKKEDNLQHKKIAKLCIAVDFVILSFEHKLQLRKIVTLYSLLVNYFRLICFIVFSQVNIVLLVIDCIIS